MTSINAASGPDAMFPEAKLQKKDQKATLLQDNMMSEKEYKKNMDTIKVLKWVAIIIFFCALIGYILSIVNLIDHIIDAINWLIENGPKIASEVKEEAADYYADN